MARRTRINARAILALAGFAAALAACNLLAGLTEDYAVDPDSATPSMTEAGDTSMVDPDGSKADSSMDGEVSVDAGRDAAPDGPFCKSIDASAVVFCADFEEAGASPFGWDSVFKGNTPSAVFTVDPTGGYYGAGLDVVTQKDASASAAAWFETIIVAGDPNQHAHYEAELDFQDVASPITYTALGIITFDDGSSNPREHGFGTFNNGVSLSKLSPQGPESILDKKEWHHAFIRLNRPTVGARYDRTLTIDKTDVVVTPAMALINSGGVQLRLGTFNTGTGSGVLHARFDNVIVRQW